MTVNEDAHTSYEMPAVSADFLQGDISTGLNRIRKRLLDLTNRNRLLNFKHTKASCLRIVDEIPDFLFERLIDGKEMSFRPVPLPRLGEIEPEKSIKNIDIAAYAESKGINPSYELGHIPYDRPKEIPKKLTDSEIQTLHFPEKLEALVGKLGNTARLAIEETGTNMLYLVFGFLEWFESPESEISHLAPLLLLPVSIRRGDSDSSTRIFRYFLSYSGEDILANISLQEKMKSEFNIDIPEVDEEDGPEQYFSKFLPILKSNERWRIRRFATISLLSFGKLLMYRDLDTSNWPKTANIQDHPRIAELFKGIQNESITLAMDYELDEEDKSGRTPPFLIDNADSSQHSVIIDALKGKNLVVEGPPGTGKSQTITNLIAAVLASGKTVLFVSEKLAALEVVRRRLDKSGLGSFCLELHSNKTKKNELLRDIENRIDEYHSHGDASSIDTKTRLLEEQKSVLRKYVQLICQPFGAANTSIFDLFWMNERLRLQTGLDEAAIARLKISDSEVLGEEDIERNTQLVELFAEHLSSICETGDGRCSKPPLAFHSWWGLENENLTFAQQGNILALLESSSDLITEVTNTITLLNQTLGLDSVPEAAAGAGEWTVQKMFDFEESVASLDRLDGEICGHALAKLGDAEIQTCLYQFLGSLSEYQFESAELTKLFGNEPTFTAAQAESIVHSRQVASYSELNTIADLSTKIDRLTRELVSIDDVLRCFGQLNQNLGLALPPDLSSLQLLIDLLDSINDVPLKHLHLRGPGLDIDGAVHTVKRARLAAAPLITCRGTLGARMNLAALPGLSEIAGHLDSCVNAGWLRIFDRSYRAAKRLRKQIAVTEEKFSKDSLISDYTALLDYGSRLNKYNRDPQFLLVFGDKFLGFDTPFDEFDSLVKWVATLRDKLLNYGEVGKDTAYTVSKLGSNMLDFYAGENGAIAQSILKRMPTPPELLESASPSASNEEHRLTIPIVQAMLGEAKLSLETFRKNLADAQFPSWLPINSVLDVIERKNRIEQLSVSLNSDELAKQLLSEAYGGVKTDTQLLRNTVSFYQGIDSSGLSSEWKMWLRSRDTTSRLRELRRLTVLLSRGAKKLIDVHGEFTTLSRLNSKQWFSNGMSFEFLHLKTIFDRTTRALVDKELLNEWVRFRFARTNASSIANASSVIELIENGEIVVSQSSNAYRLAVCRSLIESIFEIHPELEQFNGLTHEGIRRKFAELDWEIIKLFRLRAAHRIDQRTVPIGNGLGPVATHTEASLLQREIKKQRRHIPIRQLIDRAGGAIQALKPCFMMGPLSVSQYLPPGRFVFDYVIMDEASQLKPEDALGAIARGRQLVIVGDRKQLPPTSFFDRLGEENEDDGDENLAQTLEDAESILDVASAIYQPSRMLKWHYRSRHASLIAFSNKEFYDGKLIVFPSPSPKETGLGVKLRHVANATYENRSNLTEAHDVVNQIIIHIKTRPDHSLGVVTLNTVQRDVVEELFNVELKKDPSIEEYLSAMKDISEPFFIKNLENVQGDERDIIYVSITFGPNEAGHVYQRFGPINSVTGHRRLNVLFTRAKRQIVVFSSITADQVIGGPEAKHGVRALKSYLEFARTGILESASFTGREPDSDFEVAVAHELRKHGYDVVAQVGVAGFFIDLAVRHPEKPDAFVIGIECDGATYHSSKSARDRDRLRGEILTDLGWQLHRIWSTDWFRNPNGELKKIIAAINLTVIRDSL